MQTDDEKMAALGEALHGLSARLLITGALEDNTVHAAYEKVQVRFSALRHARIEALKQHAPDALLRDARTALAAAHSLLPSKTCEKHGLTAVLLSLDAHLKGDRT